MSDTVNNTTNPLAEAFETAPCGRCGGSGQYSYCQMHGTRCFGCSGKGKVYTKRAHAAIDYARALRTVKAQDVQVGMLLFVDGAGPFGGKTGWFTVTASELSNSTNTSNGVERRYWSLETSQGGLHTFPESDVQAVASKARLAEVRALALAYQATLTKQGTVAPAGYFEAEAKREARRAAKQEAARIAYEAEQAAERAREEAAAAEAQAKAEAQAAEREAARAAKAAQSEYVGVVGERAEFTVTVEHTIRFEPYAYGWAASYLYLCRDQQGNRIVYKGSGSFLGKGKTGVVAATVKGHAEYKGEKQTVISWPRCSTPWPPGPARR